MGNLRSVAKALVHVAPGASVVVTDDPRLIRSAARVVLPGQSAMPDAMAHLEATGLRDVVAGVPAPTGRSSASASGCRCCSTRATRARRPASARFRGRVVRFRDEDGACVGRAAQGSTHGLEPGAPDATASALGGHRGRASASISRTAIYPVPDDPCLPPPRRDYPAPFTCAIARANIFAMQFHPEKSQRAGLRLLANFVAWDGKLLKAFPPSRRTRSPSSQSPLPCRSSPRSTSRTATACASSRATCRRPPCSRRTPRRWRSTGSSRARSGCTSST